MCTCTSTQISPNIGYALYIIKIENDTLFRFFRYKLRKKENMREHKNTYLNSSQMDVPFYITVHAY